MKKIIYIFLVVSNLFFSQKIFAEENLIERRNLKVKSSIYYYNDEVYSGKAVNKRDRYYFKEGKANGQWISFYPNDNIKSIINWEDGKLTGKYIIYEENGIKMTETVYFQGKENGDYKVFHKNGKYRIKGQYSMGVPIGTWEYYDESGKLTGKTIINK